LKNAEHTSRVAVDVENFRLAATQKRATFRQAHFTTAMQTVAIMGHCWGRRQN